jgi:mono/diheme cytochrome c family protein
MRNIILGVVLAVALAALGGIAFLLLGLMPTNADATPPDMEKRIASSALDAAMERKAPRVNSPLAPTDDTLIDGMKIYTMNCALCHGTLDLKPSPLQHSFYPPPPQIVLEPLDDPEWHIYYAIRTGVRYTGMPAWGKTLSEQDIWKVTGFLSRVEKLPAGVQDYWKKSFGVNPPAESPDGAKKKDKD